MAFPDCRFLSEHQSWRCRIDSRKPDEHAKDDDSESDHSDQRAEQSPFSGVLLSSPLLVASGALLVAPGHVRAQPFKRGSDIRFQSFHVGLQRFEFETPNGREIVFIIHVWRDRSCAITCQWARIYFFTWKLPPASSANGKWRETAQVNTSSEITETDMNWAAFANLTAGTAMASIRVRRPDPASQTGSSEVT